jgi:hypothetical protein
MNSAVQVSDPAPVGTRRSAGDLRAGPVWSKYLSDADQVALNPIEVIDLAENYDLTFASAYAAGTEILLQILCFLL